MNRLIKNELKKIFYKKTIYFLLFVSILFVVFTNVIYKKNYIEKEKTQYSYITDDSNLSYEEKMENNELKKEYFLNKYIVDNKIRSNNNREVLLNFFNEYQILIIVFITIISSNIISFEFNRGTIKQLLIFPHKRWTIIISKIITSILILAFIIISIFILQYIVGYMFFGGFDNKIMLYNYTNEKVMLINSYKYIIIEFINKLPLFLLTILFSLFISLITNSSSLSITLSILNNIIIFPIINNSLYKIKIFKYFISPNMDLSVYLFGKKVLYNTNFIFSLYIDFIYIIILFTLILIIFEKKDIKNI